MDQAAVTGGGHPDESDMGEPGVETSQAVSAPPHPDAVSDVSLLPMCPAAPSEGASSARVAADTRMDMAATRELFQMVGAMAFVTAMLLVGWHAAHYSGAWPY
ncbi:hypothetical protein AA23498_1848 [Acetobacter nitrogenifigens DSM 23921 = NBRC 105050]|uniref:Uncharacterized protein n=1 Tax=Acetobacter nitrogenifigens DSM 23921 = NBRC 105050 TaxID=1120919 RepID=A0A511X9R6_9PROT|nr:hypothetical protein [Acetobacter nitrogenifigens]GBQ93837.1 hypothetical protein AA23498_1848 [Acetobacter nitrogenifigens DSM 23921 = NBRC 105050]GEN59688.1 hypothetical protein ANI02nite_15720 [Acetobacter nitrogenifigens DSM 23921 = NBRC 105050]